MPFFTVEKRRGELPARSGVDEALSGSFTSGKMPPSRSIPLASIQPEDHRCCPRRGPGNEDLHREIALADKGLKSGFFAGCVCRGVSARRFLSRRGPSWEKGQLTGLYAVDPQGLVTYRLVGPGNPTRGRVEVLSGSMPASGSSRQGWRRPSTWPDRRGSRKMSDRIGDCRQDRPRIHPVEAHTAHRDRFASAGALCRSSS